MPPTVVEVRNAKPGDKAYKLTDEKGLYLLAVTTGSKSWRLKYRYGGKEKPLTFGQFPEVSLAKPRDRRDAARATLRDHKDLAVEAERARRAAIAASEDKRPRWSASHAKVVMNALERDISLHLGKLPVADIDGALILRTLRKIEGRGLIETARRVLGYVAAIFKRAKGEHLVTVNSTTDLIDALTATPKGAKQPAITTLPGLIELQRTADRSSSGPVIKIASQLLAMTGKRDVPRHDSPGGRRRGVCRFGEPAAPVQVGQPGMGHAGRGSGGLRGKGAAGRGRGGGRALSALGREQRRPP